MAMMIMVGRRDEAATLARQGFELLDELIADGH